MNTLSKQTKSQNRLKTTKTRKGHNKSLKNDKNRKRHNKSLSKAKNGNKKMVTSHPTLGNENEHV